MVRNPNTIYIAAISGGKDSICMCLELVRRNWPVDYFIFTDSGVEFPECYDSLNRFEELTGRKVTRLKSALGDFYELLAKRKMVHRGSSVRKDGSKCREYGYGWPNMMRQWCTNRLKIEPCEKFIREVGKGKKVERYIGIAADEKERARNYIYPLIEWGFTEAQCLEYCRARGFYKSPCAYDGCTRMSCFCCPAANEKQISYLINERPELWARIREMELATGEPWKMYKGRLKSGGYRDCNYFEDKLKLKKG